MNTTQRLLRIILLIVVWLSTGLAQAQTKFKEYTYFGGIFHEYELEVFKLALQKTAGEYGDFVLTEAPPMTEARALRSLFDDAFPNGLTVTTVSHQHLKTQNISYVPFPLYLGVLGYRVCYVNEESKQAMAQVNTEKDLKKLVHGQGQYWRDIDILRHNGYLVAEGHKTQNLYRMLAAKRIDLFCRGTNEIEAEKPLAKEHDNISLDDSVALFYPFPFFVFTNALNRETQARIEKGLTAAYQDGSLQAAWEKHFGKSVRQAKLGQRTLYQLSNPHLQGVDRSFMQYFYRPPKLNNE